MLSLTHAPNVPQSKTCRKLFGKEAAVRQHAGEEKRDVAFEHDQDENRVDAVLTYELVEKIEVHVSVGFYR